MYKEHQEIVKIRKQVQKKTILCVIQYQVKCKTNERAKSYPSRTLTVETATKL